MTTEAIRAAHQAHLDALASLQAAADAADEDHAPRILECETDWKVSPHGDADPDRDAYWVPTLQEALADLAELQGDDQ